MATEPELSRISSPSIETGTLWYSRRAASGVPAGTGGAGASTIADEAKARRVRRRERLGRCLTDEVSVVRRFGSAGVLAWRLEAVRVGRAEVLPEVSQRDLSCGSAAGDRRLDRREIEGQQLIECRSLAGFAPEGLFLGVPLDQVDPLVDRPVSRRYESVSSSIGKSVAVAPNSGLMLEMSSRGPRARDRRRRRRRTRRRPRRRHACAASRSRRGPGRSPSSRWASSRSAARRRRGASAGRAVGRAGRPRPRFHHAVPEHAERVDRRGMRSVPTSVSGKATPSRSSTTGARNSRFTWWTMPVPGGTMRRFRNVVCAQRSN